MTGKLSASKKKITKSSGKTDSIYLAHPITSADLQSAHWKDEFLEEFNRSNLRFHLIDPSRDGFVDGKQDELIVRTNKQSISRCTALVAYAQSASAGTSMEILFAHFLHIPVITYCITRVPAWVMMHSTKVVSNNKDIIAFLKKL